MNELIVQNKELYHIIICCNKLHESDTILHLREKFYIPTEGDKVTIYFCGNSLGLQPKSLTSYIYEEVETWKRLGVVAHFKNENPWVSYHEKLSMPLALLLGSKGSEVVAMNSLTVNLHILLNSFYRPKGKRFKILIEEKAFSSDYYALSSVVQQHGFDPTEALIIVGSEEGQYIIENSKIIETIEEHAETLSLILIGGVNYYTGQFFDLQKITEAGHRAGAMIGFDLAHAIGNVPLRLHEWDVDFATWCSYKYLNAGPGGVSGIFVHERFDLEPDFPMLKGWWGSDPETRFSMENDFKPMKGAEAWQLSNPPILLMACLKSSLDVFSMIGIDRLREKSIAMTEMLYSGLETIRNAFHSEIFSIITPKNPKERGCQISILIQKKGKALFLFLEESNIKTDWREPNVIRMAPVPLYNTFEEIGILLKVIFEFFTEQVKALP